MTINPLPSGSSPIPHDNISQSGQTQASKADTPRPVSAAAAQILADLESTLQSTGKQPTAGLPPPQVNAGSIAPTANQLGSLSSSVGVDIHAMMALFQEIAQEMRSSARLTRNSEMQAQVQTQMDAVDKIREAAHDRMVGAIVSGSLQIASGAAQAAGGVMGARSLAQNSSALSAGGPQAKAILAGIDSQGQKFQGTSAALSGAGQIAQGIMDNKAANKDADKAQLDADARVHESAREDAKDLMNQMMDVIRDVRDKLGSIEQSRMETSRGIARNI